MTPLGIEIMLHYHVHAEDYRRGDHSAPAVRATIDDFVARKLLQPVAPKAIPRGDPQYELTDGGRMYVEALMAVPLPVQTVVWQIPSPSSS